MGKTIATAIFCALLPSPNPHAHSPWTWQSNAANRDDHGWCEGTCTNMLICKIGGGEGSGRSSCRGLLSVCCHTKGLRPELNRVARQLTSQATRQGIRRGKTLAHATPPASHREAPLTRRPVFIPSGLTSSSVPVSHQVTPGTRAPVHIPGEGRVTLRYTTQQPFFRPHTKMLSHDLVPSVRAPTHIAPPLRTKGVAILGGPLDIPTLGGPLLTSSHNGNLVRRERQNPVLPTFEENSIGFTSPSRSQGCGISNPSSQSRILGGTDAGYGQFPWTAIITITGSGLDKMCAGTLVQDRFILTAGHCVRYCLPNTYPNCSHHIPFSQLAFKVTLGQYDYLAKPKSEHLQKFHATEIFLHPEYTNVFRYRDSGFLESEPRNDIAILKLDRQVKRSAGTGSICLPSPSLWLGPGTLATVVGWGRMGVYEGAPHSNTLQAVNVPVLTREECLTQPGASFPTPDQLCAGFSNARESACPGDSGGGLMVRDEDKIWSLIGIVSTGPAECGLTPVIYHKVQSSLNWILDILQLSGSR